MRRNLTLWMAALLGTSALAPIPGAHAIRYADQVTNGRINNTGRPLAMTVPLDDGGRPLGELVVRINPDDTVFVSKSSLVERFGSELRPSVMSGLEKLPEFVALAELERVGVALNFDYRSLGMHTALTADQRQDGDISFAAKPLHGSSVIAKPATVSGFSNFYADTAHLWGSQETALRFSNESALRIMDFVFENEVSLENNINATLCPTNAFCDVDHRSGVKRQGSRMIYDMPSSLNRLTVGDTRTAPIEFGRAPDVLGFNLEHSPLKLNPSEQIRSTGSSSFRLERPATVEVIINGAATQRLQLPAGNYNLRDLPLRSGANDIALQITDDAGFTRTLNFTQFSGSTLLSKGKSEWSVSAGAPSYFKDGAIAYRDNQYLGSVFARYGLATNLTVEGNAQADRNVSLAGAGVTMSTPFGIWGLQGAASQSSSGLGGSGRVTWDLQGQDNIDGLRLSAEVHSQGFRTPGDFDLPLSGIIAPTFQFKQSYSGSYTRQLPDQWQMSLSARYDVADQKYYDFSPLAVRGDRYHADLSLSHPVFEDATLSGTVGYSNEFYNRSFSSNGTTNIDDTRGSLWAGLRLYWRPTSKTTITAATDSINQRSYVNGSYVSSTGVDSWSSNVAVSDDRPRGSTGVSAGATYTGQRAEVAVAHDTGFTTFAPGGAGFGVTQQRTSARVGTALVFADDRAAISSPIRSQGGFAILYPHESIEGKEITAGSKDYKLAQSDIFGPAVVPSLSSYTPQTIPVDVADLPPGYSLGSGGFDISPSYRSGYALQVGSGYSVTLFGVMLDRQGKPVALTSGTASNGSKTVTIFTNQAGKFAADGLAPGVWTLSMAGEDGPLSYSITVPKGAKGLVKAGELRP